MKNIIIKLKEVYLPFLLVDIATFLFYNLFRWTLDIKLGILPLKEDLLNFWIPFVLPWIPISIWIRRRIRVLRVNGKQGNGYFGYQFIMVAAIAVPTFVSQNYLEKASFDLVSVNTANEVTKTKKEKYFEINSFQINKNTRLPYATARTSGKHNDKLNYYLYYSCPFKGTKNVWFGLEYSMQLSNHSSDREKREVYQDFWERSERKFSSYDFQKIKYFEKLGYSDERDGYLEAIKKTFPDLDKSKQIILIPKFDVFEDRMGNSFYWIFSSFGICALVILLMVVIPRINEKELKYLKTNKSLKKDDLKDMMAFLDPRGANKATAILLLLNIAVFVIMIFLGLNIVSPTAKELLEIGGNRRIEVMDGAYWRLFTSIFIHAGLMHLLMNLLGLGLGAGLLEGILGSTRLILSYSICGVVASLTSIVWHENTVSVGASGAIFGLYGLILAFTIFKIYPTYMRRMNWVLLGLYAGVSLLFGFLGGVDNAAHFGGLISGFILGLLFILYDEKKLIKNAR